MKINSNSTIIRIKQDLAQVGFHHSRNFNEAELLEVSHGLGVPTPDGRNNPVVKILMPGKLEDPRRMTLSSKYGTDAFPCHTETAYWPTPAHFLLLYCVNPGSGDRPTYLADSNEWPLTDTERSILFNEVWKVFTGISPFLCTIAKAVGRKLMIRYDRDCMRPALPAFSQAQNLLVRELGRAERVEIRWEVGDLLVIDNHRILHARGVATASDSDRCLKRILILRKGS